MYLKYRGAAQSIEALTLWSTPWERT